MDTERLLQVKTWQSKGHLLAHVFFHRCYGLNCISPDLYEVLIPSALDCDLSRE